LVEFDSADRDSGKSFIVIADPGKYDVQTDVTPNNGATYTVKIEECSTIQEGPPPEDTTPEVTAPENTTPSEGKFTPKKIPPEKKQPPGNVSNPKDIVKGSEAKKIPNTGGPPYFVLGALALLGGALIAGRGVLRR
jgi:hypothetical protein